MLCPVWAWVQAGLHRLPVRRLASPQMRVAPLPCPPQFPAGFSTWPNEGEEAAGWGAA